MKRSQIAIVGGGPAGLSAAIAAAAAGAEVTLFDEQDAPGGNLLWRRADIHGPDGQRLSAAATASGLRQEAVRAGVDIVSGAVVWGLFAEHVLGVAPRRLGLTVPADQVQAERIILATGSTDFAFPFPGGTLPGVFSHRAVQILMNRYAVRPGRRFVILGDGTEASELADDIRAADGEVVVHLPIPAGVTADPVGDVLIASGEDGVEKVTFGGVEVAADVIVVAIGRQPDAQLATMAGCELTYEASLGGWIPVRSETLETTKAGLYVVGDAAGLAPDGIAVLEGTVAGLAAAQSLGLGTGQSLDQASAALRDAAPDRMRTEAGLHTHYVQA